MTVTVNVVLSEIEVRRLELMDEVIIRVRRKKRRGAEPGVIILLSLPIPLALPVPVCSLSSRHETNHPSLPSFPLLPSLYHPPTLTVHDY